MILVDTSIWVDHLRHADHELSKLLNEGLVLTHPFVIGELALGTLQKRDMILDALKGLPQTCVATDDEVHHFIERNALFDIGIGYIDVHLLAAVLLSPGSLIWTKDKRLHAVSARLNVAAKFAH